MTSIIKPIWRELGEQCRADPTRAVSEMRAVCDSTAGDPLKGTVTGSPGQGELAVGLHPSVGGDGSAPCPGELVAMALAACMDASVRVFADVLGIELDRVHVEVVNRGDMRVFLRATDVEAPADTGISMRVAIEARDATEEQLANLRQIAEAASGVLYLLRNPIGVNLTWS